MYAKYVNNQQREGRAINVDINRIGVVKYSMNRNYHVLVDYEDAIGARIVWKICNRRKRQP